jgi:hypothetical protein
MQTIRAQQPRSRNLVFTSAGDRSNVRRWLRGRRREFDLWINYYGERPAALRSLADIYSVNKGTKFQNLHYCYSRWPELFASYEAVMVMDDDIIIDGDALTRLFELQRELDLWALQPAFRIRGKLSWNITRVQPTTRLRYTNFIEMTCPLFRRDKLDAFMAAYDPTGMGYGDDWWFLGTLGPDLVGRVAVVDEVSCINPHDRSKGGRREIDRLSSPEERKAMWQRNKARHGLAEVRDHKEFGRIEKPTIHALLGRARFAMETTYVGGRRVLRRVLGSLWQSLPREPSKSRSIARDENGAASETDATSAGRLNRAETGTVGP